MATFKELTENEKKGNKYWSEIYGIIANRETEAACAQDGQSPIELDTSELEAIQQTMYECVRDELVKDGAVQTASEMRESLRLDVKAKFDNYIAQAAAAARQDRSMQNNPGIVQDGYYNPVSGIGTPIDPGMSTQSFIPVSLTPTEATSYYANGGLPAKIINKKAGCLALNGLHFKCDEMSAEDLTKLEQYAEKVGFTAKKKETDTQALIFGGAFMYPVFKGDSPLQTQQDRGELLKSLPEKDFIKYFVVADRWNCVFVPNYTITAKDYLYARSIFVPLGGYRVNTQRVAMVRPSRQPFWSAIKQMGWSTSDFEGWIKDYESYEIMKMSLPIMAQQASLMYHSFPADGLIIENGPEYARRFMRQNEAEMREWSMLNPKAINSVGEIKILERTYSGFQQLIQESRLALSASSNIPSSALFPEKATGLASDNEDDITLKQSETIRLLFDNVSPAYQNVIDWLVLSCFGKNSEQAKYARSVTIAPDQGVVLSDQDKAQLGSSFTQIIGGLVAVGAPLNAAVTVARKFIPSADLDEKTLEAMGAGEAAGMDAGLWEMLNAGRGGPAQGMF